MKTKLNFFVLEMPVISLCWKALRHHLFHVFFCLTDAPEFQESFITSGVFSVTELVQVSRSEMLLYFIECTKRDSSTWNFLGYFYLWVSNPFQWIGLFEFLVFFLFPFLPPTQPMFTYYTKSSISQPFHVRFDSSSLEGKESRRFV